MRVEERRRDPLEPRLELDSQHSWSRERLEALCLSLPCRASPRQPMHAGRWVSMPVGLAESRPDATAPPALCYVRTMGQGLKPRRPSLPGTWAAWVGIAGLPSSGTHVSRALDSGCM